MIPAMPPPITATSTLVILILITDLLIILVNLILLLLKLIQLDTNTNNIIKLDSNNIPSKIFQTWEHANIEPEFQQIINKWKENNPNYEYILQQYKYILYFTIFYFLRILHFT